MYLDVMSWNHQLDVIRICLNASCFLSDHLKHPLKHHFVPIPPMGLVYLPTFGWFLWSFLMDPSWGRNLLWICLCPTIVTFMKNLWQAMQARFVVVCVCASVGVRLFWQFLPSSTAVELAEAFSKPGGGLSFLDKKAESSRHPEQSSSSLPCVTSSLACKASFSLNACSSFSSASSARLLARRALLSFFEWWKSWTLAGCKGVCIYIYIHIIYSWGPMRHHRPTYMYKYMYIEYYQSHMMRIDGANMGCSRLRSSARSHSSRPAELSGCALRL